jgi:hypothetical protein
MLLWALVSSSPKESALLSGSSTCDFLVNFMSAVVLYSTVY